MEGAIRVLWTCEMKEACTNAERPGVHDDYKDAGICRGVISAEQLKEEARQRTRRIDG